MTNAGEGLKTYRQTLEKALAEVRDVMDRKARGEDVRLFIPTGLKAWDANGGIDRGILTVIGAATGDGKSFVKLHLAVAAAKAGYRVLMLDFEDPGAKTAHRTLSNVSGIDNRAIAKLEIDEFDYERLERALAVSEEWADRIHHRTGLVDTQFALSLMRSGRWDLILVDYAQCFPEEAGETMESTIRHFARDANLVAQEQNSAVVVFSQLKAEIEVRGRKTYDQAKYRDPQSCDVSGYCPNGLADVAWAKAMGDSAKCLLYIWRPNRMAKKLTGSTKIKDNRLRIIAGKASFAGEDDLEFLFDGATATIRDLED